MKKKDVSNFWDNEAFTLIELLIVISIIAFLLVAIFVFLDPLRMFRDARDAQRRADATEFLLAIKLDQVDNVGEYLTAINNMDYNIVYMIGTDTENCDNYNDYCDTNVTSSNSCVNLGGLVTEGYLGAIPISPNGKGSWTVGHAGYTLERTTVGTITIRACESEFDSEIIKYAR